MNQCYPTVFALLVNRYSSDTGVSGLIQPSYFAPVKSGDSFLFALFVSIIEGVLPVTRIWVVFSPGFCRLFLP